MAAFEDDPPKYARVVATLRKRIEDGTYPPGALLPSEYQLATEFGVSRPTVVQALRILRQDGWIDTQQGKGSFVRGRPPAASAEHARAGQLLLDQAESETTGELVQAGIVTAPKRIATLLGLSWGSKAFVRQRLVTDDGEPVELVSAWFPLDLADTTSLASPEPLPEGIRAHLQRCKSVRLDHAVERISARHPTADEARILKISQHAPVLTLAVTGHDATGRPVQVVDVVMPADRHELEDTYSLT